MSIFNENLDGISNHKCPDLLLSSSTADYDVLSLGETWLTAKVKNAEFLDKQYNVFRKDRSSTHIAASASIGGGVLIAVRYNIHCEEFSTDEMSNLEAVCVRIPTARGYIYIYSLYIQPTASIEVYRLHIEAIISITVNLTAFDTIVIMGDFNLGNSTEWLENDSGFDFIPLIGESQSAKSVIAREVTTRLLDCGLFQISNLENTSGNVLDLFYTNVPELADVKRADILMLPSFKSDPHHVPTMCLIDCAPTIINNTETQSIYCFKRANYDLIRDHLVSLNLQHLFTNSSGDVNELTSQLYSLANDTFEKFVPSTTIRATNNPRWYNKGLARLKNHRNKAFIRRSLHRKKTGTDSEIHKEDFIAAREDYESYRKLLFSNFLRDQASSLKSDPKSFWRHINSKRVSNSIPSIVTYKNQQASSEKDKANLFAEFFQTVYSDFDMGDPEIIDFIRNRNDINCYNIECTTESVFAVLSTMDLSKGCGNDGISPLFLRECAEILAAPLSIIFNKSMRDGIYPDLFKIGQVTPIFKSGQKTNVENYRGVNVLPGFAKVFERVVHNQLKLIIPPKISTTQHGFVSNRNIETNLMEMTTMAHDAFESKAQLDVFYADISKAFDTVNPIKLIKKLAKFRVSNTALIWLLSYLNQRRQYVKVGSAKSNIFDVTSGVGQGTILGPLLFIVFFDDSNYQEPSIHLSNFADDKKIGVIVKNLDDAQRLQGAIDKFLLWCKENDLDINFSKCKLFSLYTKNKPIIYNYTIDGRPIERVSEIRDLGVIIDRKMNFNRHIEYVCNKANAALQFVKRQSFYFEKDIIKILYFALVRSNLEFASVIWSPHYITHKKFVERTQKQIVMLLNGDFRRRLEQNNFVLAPYTDRCATLDLQTLLRRRVNASALFIHSIISGKYNAPNLRSKLQLNRGIRTIRNPEFIRLKMCHTNHSTASPFNNACRIFNCAALFIDPSLPHYQFKEKLLQIPDAAFGQWTQLK